MSWLSLPRFGPTSVGTDMTRTGKAQILKDSTDRARMLLHFGQPLINQVNSISQATLLTSDRLVVVATCSLAPMWVMVIEYFWDTFWPDPSKDLRFRRL